MRTLICIFIVMVLAASFGIWKFTLDTGALNSQIRNSQKEIAALKLEAGDIDKYKDEQGLSLEKFYPEIFNDIKEVTFYCHADSEIKIIGSKDLVSTEEFFKASKYKGVRYVDILCRINVKKPLDTYSFEMLYKIIKNKSVEILEVKMEKDILNLTMRLYGP